ncbi:hypothetical protein C1H46_019966 [Malus baccata]|uniref:Uncharacterized protein n=1 Tax=Malus baccata TaxID=106549 RepID=A0A540M6U1_MALBA|nr:hypothetical protein C1H46_019966 [Malus baccata]
MRDQYSIRFCNCYFGEKVIEFEVVNDRAKISLEKAPWTSAQLPTGLALWMCSWVFAC